MPSFPFRAPKNRPEFDVSLARQIYGQDLDVMTEAECHGSHCDTDLAPEQEDILYSKRTAVLTNDEVLRRLQAFESLTKELANLAGLVGSNAFNAAMGSWDDAYDCRSDSLDELQREAGAFSYTVGRIANNLRRTIINGIK